MLRLFLPFRHYEILHARNFCHPTDQMPPSPVGEQIPIQERDRLEVTHVKGHQLAPEGVRIANYAFDVTPKDLVSAMITEKGVARAPYSESLKAQFEE